MSNILTFVPRTAGLALSNKSRVIVLTNERQEPIGFHINDSDLRARYTSILGTDGNITFNFPKKTPATILGIRKVLLEGQTANESRFLDMFDTGTKHPQLADLLKEIGRILDVSV